MASNDLTFLRRGDLIYLEVGPLEGCESGGLFGAEPLKTSSERLTKTHADSPISTEALLGISPFLKKGGIDTLPESYFMNCIFEIASGVGLDAPGEPIFYGSQIQLVHRRSGRYLRSSKDLSFLDLISAEEYNNAQTKECHFNIFPKHRVFKERDTVCANDLVQLTDFMNRAAFCASSTKIMANDYSWTAFRIKLYCSFTNETQAAIKGGDFIQLYHKGDRCFLTCALQHTAHSARSDMPPDVIVTALERESSQLEQSCGYWQIETINAKNHRKQTNIDEQDAVSSFVDIRLHHVLYDKYLSLVGGKFTVSDEETHDGIFQLHILSNKNINNVRESNSKDYVKPNSSVRLYHVHSKRYIVLENDYSNANSSEEGGGGGTSSPSQRNNLCFSSSVGDDDFDKDIFQVLAVTRMDLDIVIQGKTIITALEFLLKRMQTAHASRSEKIKLMKTATVLLCQLTSDSGFLSDVDPDAEGPEKSRFVMCQNIANELGFVRVTLALAECAFASCIAASSPTKESMQQQAPQFSSPHRKLSMKREADALELSDFEDNLAKACYEVITILIRDNSDVVQVVIGANGVSKMIKHACILVRSDAQRRQLGGSRDEFDFGGNKRKAEWMPPLLSLVIACYLWKKKYGSSISLVTEDDVRITLDCIYNILVKNQVPSPFLYKFLSYICRPPGVEIMLEGVHPVNAVEQEMICNHLLGTQEMSMNPISHPFWSVFLYRTRIVDAGSAPDVGEAEKKLLITTSVIGQRRPSTTHHKYLAVRPVELAPNMCNDDDWEYAVNNRNKISPFLYTHSELKYFNHKITQLSPVREVVDYMSTFDNDWVSLDMLSDEQFEFYRASLNLLAALCCGRNVYTQSIIRKLVPASQLLFMLSFPAIVDRSSPSSDDTKHQSKAGGITTQLAVVTKAGFNPLASQFQHSTISLQASVMNLLLHCYVDSALLPPMQLSGYNSIEHIVIKESIENEHLPWPDVFHDELHCKVFGLISHEEENLIEINEDTSEEELRNCLTYLNSPQYHILLHKEQVMMPTQTFARQSLNAYASNSVDKEIFGFIHSQLAKPTIKLNKDLSDFLHQQRHIQKISLAHKNIRGVAQRAHLLHFMNSFVERDAMKIWEYGVQQPLLQMTGPDQPVVMNLNKFLRMDEMRDERANRIKINIDYMKMMITTLHTLLLCRFFDSDYNANPRYKSGTKPSTKKGEHTVSVGPEGIASGKGVASGKEGEDDFFYNFASYTASNSKYHVQTDPETSRQLLVYGSATSLSPTSPKHGGGGGGGSSFANVPDILERIVVCLLRIVECHPGEVINPQWMLTDDESMLTHYFRRQFGYDRDMFGLVAATIEVKTMCCKALLACMELIQSRTAMTLWSIYQQIVGHIKDEKFKELHGGLEPVATASMAKITNNIVHNLKSSADKARIKLSESDRQEIRAATTRGLVSAKGLCWNLNDLFQDKLLQTLLNLTYFSSPTLRAESLHLLYRCGARRADFSKYLYREFQQPTDIKEIAYISRKKSSLQQIFSKFRIDHGDEAPLPFSIEEHELQKRLNIGKSSTFSIVLNCVKIKKHFYSNDSASTTAGIINFCFDNDAVDVSKKKGAVLSAMLLKAQQQKASEAISQPPSEKSPVTPGKVELAPIKTPGGLAASNSSPFKLPALASIASASAQSGKAEATAGATPAAPSQQQTTSSTSSSILRRNSNKQHQRLLIDYDFHNIIVGFIHKHGRQFTKVYGGNELKTSSSYAALRTASSTETAAAKGENKQLLYYYGEVFRLCFLFLRALIQKNPTTAKAISTPAVIEIILLMRFYCDEALALLQDLLHFNNDLLQQLTEIQFFILLNDIKEVVSQIDFFKKYHGEFGLSIRNCIKGLRPITFIVCNEAERLQQFMTFLFKPVNTTVGGVGTMEPLIQKVFSMGLGVQSERVPNQLMASEVQHIVALFQAESVGEVALAVKQPTLMLEEEPLGEAHFELLRESGFFWPTLQPQCSLRMHLEVVSLFATVSKSNVAFQKLVKAQVKNPMAILQIMLIDSVEIRKPYLSLFHGLWYSAQPGAMAPPSSFLAGEYRLYMKALFLQFLQDFRLFAFLIQDVACGSSWRSKDARSYYELFTAYIVESVLPFLSDCIALNLFSEFDDKAGSGPKGVVDNTPPLYSILLELLQMLMRLMFSHEVYIHTIKSALHAITLLFSGIGQRTTEETTEEIREMLTDDPRQFLQLAMNVFQIHKDFAGPIAGAEGAGAGPDFGARRASVTGGKSPFQHNEKEMADSLRMNVLTEFIPIVDEFAMKSGYQLESMYGIAKVDEEHSTNPFVDLYEFNGASPSVVPSTANSTLLKLMNPLNCITFQYISNCLSKKLVDYIIHTSNDGRKAINEVRRQLHTIPVYLQEDKEARESTSVLRTFTGYAKVHDSSHLTSSKQYFFNWTKGGGKLINFIMGHILYCLSCFHGVSSFDSTSFSYNDICQCNYYFVAALTNGALKSRLEQIFEEFCEQTELQIAQTGVELKRVRLMQEYAAKLQTTDVCVKQISVSLEKLRSKVNSKSIELIRQMAIDLGTSLIVTGNKVLQDIFVSTIEEDYHRNIAMGYEYNFLGAVRSMLKTYSKQVATNQNFNQKLVDEIRRLLKFLSLLCEGHNAKSQSFLGDYGVVSGVANFTLEIATIFSSMVRRYMVSVAPLNLECQPRVLNQPRLILNWATAVISQAAAAAPPRTPPPLTPKGGVGMSKVTPTFRAGNDNESSKAATSKTNYELLDTAKLALYCHVIREGLEALAEFCQGPCFENQLMITRAGVTAPFKTLFEMFGSYQLLCEFSAPPAWTDRQKYHEAEEFRRRVKGHVTHEGVSSLHRKLMWVGNDPLAIYILCQYMKNASGGSGAHNLDSSSGLPDLSDGSSRRGGILGWFRTHKPLYQEDSEEDMTLLQNSEHNRDLSAALDESKHSGSELDVSRHGASGAVAAISTLGANASSKEKAQVPQLAIGRSKLTEWLLEKEQYVVAVEADEEPPEENDFFKIQAFGEVLTSLEQSCLKFTASLLEGNSNEDDEIPRIVLRNIGEHNLMCNMDNYWGRYIGLRPKAGSKVSESECYERQMSYDYYGLVMGFCDIASVSGDLKEMVDLWLVRNKEYHFDKHIARIEVRMGERTAVTYFPIPSIVNSYWYRGDIIALRDEIVFPSESGTRDSADEKVKSFLKEGQNLIAALRHVDSLDEVIAVKSLLHYAMVKVAHLLDFWGKLTFAATIFINVIMIIGVRSHESNGNGVDVPDPRYKVILYYAGWAHLGCTAITTLSYIIMYGWLYIKMGMQENPLNEVSFYGFVLCKVITALHKLGLLGTEVIQDGNNITVRLWPATIKFKYFFERPLSIYYACLLTFSLLGNFRNTLFFALCLIELLRMSKLMQYVTRAFTDNFDQVAATVVLAALILYFFAVLEFSVPTLHNQYNFNGMQLGGCYSLNSCFRMHLDYGLQSVFWNSQNDDGTMTNGWQEFYNFIFNFIIQIVIPGLVSGIIIDTFSNMRENNEAVREDVFNTCFICNIDREDFESNSVSFADHIKNDHNMWKYLWFILYLNEKDPTEFTGVEQYCNEIIKLKDNSITWMPIKMARALSSMRDKYDLYSIYHKVSGLHQGTNRLEVNMKNELSKREKAMMDFVKGELGLLQEVKDSLSELLITSSCAMGRRASSRALIPPSADGATAVEQVDIGPDHSNTN